MAWISQIRRFSIVVLALVVSAFGLNVNAQKPAPAPPAAPKAPALVSIASLQTLMPAVDGWTRAPLAGDVVQISEVSAYSFAEGDFTNGAMKAKLTIGDTVGVDDCLMAMAALVVVLPAGYSERVPAGSEISRFEFGGGQAASKWNAVKMEGEFSVVINGRFVVKAEGTGIDSIDTLRGLVSQIDLKKLAALKPGK